MSAPVSGELLSARRLAKICLRCGKWPALTRPYLCNWCVRDEQAEIQRQRKAAKREGRR